MNFAEIHRELSAGAPTGAVDAWTATVLADIAAGRRDVTAVRHPLGFLCLPVIRVGPDGVCVHVWAADRAPPTPTTSAVHSHSWELTSYVLYGDVVNETVELLDPAGGATHRVFEVHSADNVDEIRATPRLVRPRTAMIDTSGLGEVYTLRAGRFHRTEVADGRAAATVALGHVRSGALDLSLGDVHGRTHQVRRVRCDRSTTARVALTVAAQLSVSAS